MDCKLQQIRQSFIFALNFLRKQKIVGNKRQKSTEEQPLIYHLYENNYPVSEDNYAAQNHTTEENLIQL